MEWTTAAVNDMLKDEITKLNYTLIPPGCHGDVRSVRIVQESLGKLIDSLGEQSATAQGLSKAITTAEKLRNAPTHILYLLKDAANKNGAGEIIGFLKVAFKHLYLFDERGKVRQVEPLCVLDFYVSGARQRRGNGKRLFDFMLQDTGSRPQDLAIDGPSSKMETFLAKNYGVDRLMRQSNNFAVSPAFFLTPADSNKSGRNTPVVPTEAVGRFTARKPPSSIADVIHGQTDRVYVETNNGKSGRNTPVVPTEAVGRFTARKPPSSIADVIHGQTDRVYVETNNGKSGRNTPVIPTEAVGRFTARKPPSSMADVIHGQTDRVYVETNNGKSGRNTPVIPTEAVGRFTARKPPSSMADVIHGQTDRVYVETNNGTPEDAPGPKALSPEPVAAAEPEPEPAAPTPPPPPASPSPEPAAPTPPPPPASPSPEPAAPPPPPPPASPSPEPAVPTLPVAPAAAAAPPPAGSAAPRRDSQLTAQGYFDVKFYHNKLW